MFSSLATVCSSCSWWAGIAQSVLQLAMGLTLTLKKPKQWCKAGDPEEEEH